MEPALAKRLGDLFRHLSAQVPRRPLGRSTERRVWGKWCGTCAFCGDEDRPVKPLRVAHIQPVAEGGTDDLVNLLLLCDKPEGAAETMGCHQLFDLQGMPSRERARRLSPRFPRRTRATILRSLAMEERQLQSGQRELDESVSAIEAGKVRQAARKLERLMNDYKGQPLA